jgi:hypothetical protein
MVPLDTHRCEQCDRLLYPVVVPPDGFPRRGMEAAHTEGQSVWFEYSTNVEHTDRRCREAQRFAW